MLFIIKLSNLCFLGEQNETQKDLCLHGNVFIQIVDHVLDDGKVDQWTVSAGALRLLRSVVENHYAGSEEHLMPCCGHFMIPSDDLQTVNISGCPNGLDFTVLHKDNTVELITDKNSISIPFDEYKNTVLKVAEEVELFYHDSPPKKLDNDFDKEGYQAFWNEWQVLKEKSIVFDPLKYNPHEIDFSDYITITDQDIISVGDHGLWYKTASSSAYINFIECSYNYERSYGGSGKCVGERDITGSNPSIIFYTAPLTTHIFFMSGNKLKEVFSKNSVQQRFHKLQNQIVDAGFLTFDLS